MLFSVYTVIALSARNLLRWVRPKNPNLPLRQQRAKFEGPIPQKVFSSRYFRVLNLHTNSLWEFEIFQTIYVLLETIKK